MFSKIAIVLSALALAVSVQASQCNTGPVQCCNSVKSSDDKSVSGILAAVGAVVQGVVVQVGLDCSPISAIGVGANSCTAQPVCCTNNNFNGVVALGCTPINVNL
ncbi:fungal hydrophobin [Cyathus striatus]|nr:fungal hydrophobin [Cyathus striatus]